MHRLKNKVDLGFFPTPLHKLKNFSEKFKSYNIFIKRDDQTGLATGGNKTRKLEYLLKDAVDLACDTIITAGAQQSNHCRQTAAASAQMGLNCHLLLNGIEPETYNGNLLLSKLLGANIHYCGENRKGEGIDNVKIELEKKGLKPYIVPYGGSNLTGAFGYINAVKELKEQAESKDLYFDYIFFASSSGGTYSGLLLGNFLYNFKTELMPVNIDKEETTGKTQADIVADIVTEGIELFRLPTINIKEKINIIKRYDAAGYGVLTSDELNIIKTLAEIEGIILDPVYTARAFYAMTDHLYKKILKPNSNILFWHTGGITANFGYSGAYY